MTKNYDIIALNNHLYMVDKEEEAYPWVYLHKKKEVIKINGVGEKSGELFHEKGFNFKEEGWKIVASTDASLGLPLLPDITKKQVEELNSLGVGEFNRIADITPKSTSVEVEMEHEFDTGLEPAYGELIPKAVNNIIQIKRWIYG